MGCPVLKTPDQLDVRLMPANANHAPGAIAKQLAEMYGLQKQRHNTMDGSSPSNMNHRTIRELAETPHMALSIIPSQTNDMRDTDLTMEQINLQLDLIEKAGDMVDQMEAAIAEIVNNIDSYSEHHIEQILTVVENTHTLDMVNDGRIALPTAEIEKLATETLDAMEQLFNDDVLPPTLKEVTLPIIEKTAAIFQIPSLDTKIQEFKHNTSEVSKLAKTIDALKATLAEILLQDDLSDELREEIEEKLEQLDALEDGEPLPRELMKDIEALSEKIIEAGIPLASELKAQVATVKEQNVLARAEIHNMSPAQVRAIDSYMDKLEILGQNLPNNEDTVTLKDLIADALISLDKNPSSIEAMAAVETVAAHISDPKIISPIISKLPEPTLLQKIFPILQTQSKFVVKTQTDSIAKNQNVSTAKVREASALYRTLAKAKNAIKSLIPANTNQNEASKAQSNNNSQKPEVFTDSAPTPRAVILQKLTNQINSAQKALNKSIDSVSTTIELGMLATSKTFQQMTQRLEPLRQAPEQLKNFLTTNIQAIAKKFEAPARHPAGCPCCNTAFGRAAHLPVIGGIAKKLDIIFSSIQQTKEAKHTRNSFDKKTDTSSLDGLAQPKSKLGHLTDLIKSGCDGCNGTKGCCGAFSKVAEFLGLKQKNNPSTKDATPEPEVTTGGSFDFGPRPKP